MVVDEQQLAEASARLARLVWPPRVLRSSTGGVWSRATLLELGCGWERGRVLIPVRNGDGELRGVLRYAPTHDRAPKMLAARGTRLGLIPHPAAEPSTWVVLVEGPPDMIGARSQGLPAIAVPGDDAWEPEWAQLLVGRYVSIVLDCDHAGREAAARIAGDLRAVGVRGSIIDLAPPPGRLRPDRLALLPPRTARRRARPGARRTRHPRRALRPHGRAVDDPSSLRDVIARGRLLLGGLWLRCRSGSRWRG